MILAPEADSPPLPPTKSAPPGGGKTAVSQPAIRSAREFFGVQGIDEKRLGQLSDGQPWTDTEKELLLKILYRLGHTLRPWDLQRWSRGSADAAGLPRAAKALRGEVLHFAGRVLGVEVVELSPENAERYEMSRYYRCRLRLQEGQMAAVVAPKVPAAWKTGQPIDEATSGYGVFLKLERSDEGQSIPAFAASRLAWYPRTPLGRLGMDVGLLDDVRMPADPGLPPGKGDSARLTLDDLRLTGNDRECFYQMLAAVGRSAPGALLREAQQEAAGQGGQVSPVVRLFNQPGEQQGKLFVLSGTARRVLRVPVNDPEIVSRFGIDHFFQVYLFTGDSQGNPLVFCLRELPPGMPTGDGARYGEEVTVAGFFLKTWAYRIRLPEADSSRRSPWQLAPLLIGRDAMWRPASPPSRKGTLGLWGAGFVVVLGLGIWILLWQVSRKDRQFERKFVAREFSMDLSDISLPRETGKTERPEKDATNSSAEEGKTT